ncbi:aspartyl/asparaginyl beta-hydroxylase domain-containing protein [Microbulbifer agarilyticus]
MQLDQPLKLLEERDISTLQETVLNVTAQAWESNQVRQQSFDVHYQTQSLVMLFIKCEAWPQAEISREDGWDVLEETALPVIRDIISKHYPPGGIVLRAMAAKLIPGGVIKPHIDAHPSFRLAHRIHIPLTSNPRVRFNIGGRPHQLQPGSIYEINNQLQHSVMNKGSDDRITFIFDYLPPKFLRDINATGVTRLW